MTIRAAFFLVALLCVPPLLPADQVEMQNGDRYIGKVVTMTGEDVVLQSDVLGKIILPRGKVSSIILGPPTNHPPGPSLIMTNGNPSAAAALKNLGANTNLMEQVRQQFLRDAGPDANKKFDELAGDLMSGRMDLNGLRAQAKAAADQIRSLKGQGGGADELLDSYLAILDNFLKETENGPSSAPAPNTNNTPGTILIR